MAFAIIVIVGSFDNQVANGFGLILAPISRCRAAKTVAVAYPVPQRTLDERESALTVEKSPFHSFAGQLRSLE
jgi:hypothetical protein